VDCGEEVSRSFVVAGCDGAVLLELADEVLDEVAFLVEVLVVIAGVLPVRFWRNDRCFPGVLEWLSHPLIGVEGFVGDQDSGLDGGKKSIGAVQIVGLACRKMKARRVAEGIDGDVYLGA
jgi:hypothetical protein